MKITKETLNNPIIKAYAEGKIIQYDSADFSWADIVHGIDLKEFLNFPDRYRIKPESKRVPLTQEELALARWIKYPETPIWYFIERLGPNCIFSGKQYFLEELESKNIKWSTDGLNWKNFYKEI